MKYRKKTSKDLPEVTGVWGWKGKNIPEVVSAWRWQDSNLSDVQLFTKDNGLPNWGIGDTGKGLGLLITNSFTQNIAEDGDYIIKTIYGEYYPCNGYIFEGIYSSVVV